MKLKEYNEYIDNWDYESNKTEDFFKLLSERNMFLQKKLPKIDFYPENNEIPQNKVYTNHTSIKELDKIAIHAGVANQIKLLPFINKETNHNCNEGVFFSTLLWDVKYYGDLDKNPETMFYFLDLSIAKNVKVQINYGSDVISRYDLDFIDINDKISLKKLKSEHIKANELWLKKNSIDFNLLDLIDYKKKRFDWLIVGAPIEVIY